MSIVNSIDTITDWARENICSKVMLKVAPLNGKDGKDYNDEYELRNPEAFPIYLPPQNRAQASPAVTAPDIDRPNCPCVCVKVTSADDRLMQSKRRMKIMFMFCAWDPGLHKKDVFDPNGDSTFSYLDSDEFRRNIEGWRDACNFLDIALRELESVFTIGNLRIVHEDNIQSGPMTDQEIYPANHPYFFAWCEFSVEEALIRTSPYQDKL